MPYGCSDFRLADGLGRRRGDEPARRRPSRRSQSDSSAGPTAAGPRHLVEVQLNIDKEKIWRWPEYLTGVRGRHECDTVLLVVCPDLKVATWSGTPIRLGPGSSHIAPMVVGPPAFPIVTDHAAAIAAPVLAAMSLAGHPDDANVRRAVIAAHEQISLSTRPRRRYTLTSSSACSPARPDRSWRIRCCRSRATNTRATSPAAISPEARKRAGPKVWRKPATCARQPRHRGARRGPRADQHVHRPGYPRRLDRPGSHRYVDQGSPRLTASQRRDYAGTATPCRRSRECASASHSPASIPRRRIDVGGLG